MDRSLTESVRLGQSKAPDIDGQLVGVSFHEPVGYSSPLRDPVVPPRVIPVDYALAQAQFQSFRHPRSRVVRKVPALNVRAAHVGDSMVDAIADLLPVVLVLNE